MKPSRFRSFALCIFWVYPFLARPLASWTGDPFEQKVFVENKGQFGEISGQKPFYAARSSGVDIYFTAKGIVYRYDHPEIHDSKQANEKKEIKPLLLVSEVLKMEWLNANPGAAIVAEGKQSFYFTYGSAGTGTAKNIIANVFSKITYKNLYPNIDVEYIFPADKTGIKYNLVLHPGADVSMVKMMYEQASALRLDANGNLIITSSFGDFTDHAPFTFYQNTQKQIPASFILNGNVVSFQLPLYNTAETLVIDPWTSNPTFTGFNASYDIDYDNAGNVYVLGSYNPLQYAKFDNAGNLQWVYNMAPNAYGDFAVDYSTGISYIAEGKTGPTLVHEVSPAGILTAQGASPDGEMWRMVFNPVTSECIIGNTGSVAEIMDLALNFNLVNVTLSLMNDNTLLAIDNCNSSNDVYMAGNSGVMVKVPAATLGPVAWQANTGYTFFYAGCRNVGGWIFPVQGYNGMAVGPNWLYTYDGAVLKKWNKSTGALIGNVNVTGTPFKEGGLAADECDNVFVGANSSIVVYDQSLNLITTIALPDTVYDIKLGRNNLIYACGIGFTTEIALPPALSTVLTLSQTPASCSACNGTATVAVTSPCLTSSYFWSPGGQTTATATGLCGGVYTVTVTNGCNNIFTDTITVQGSATLAATTSQQNVLCNGQSNGTATATPTGGTAPYTYSWSNSQTTQSISNLIAGTYTVTITDANGCSTTITITITQPNALSASTTFNNTTCGNNNGSATVTANGGTGPYTYSWAPSGATSAGVSNLPAGTYTVYVTDANNCSQTATVIINPSSGPTLNLLSQVNVLCNGDNTGSANMNASGGTGPYTYSWNNGQTNANATGLTANTYTCYVTDAANCTVQLTVTITQPAAISITTNSTQTTCTGSTGTASANASGGTPGYTYSWSNAMTGQNISGLGAGTYTVYVTDANNCTQNQTVTVTSNNPVTLTATATPTACSSNTGTATANPANGTTPYTYSWSNGQTTQTAIALGAGTYTVTVTDANGCSQTQTVNVVPSSGPAAAAAASFTTITLGGSSQLTAAGGGTYSWYPSTGLSCVTCTNPVATPNQTTTYCVIVTDANGCTDSACVTITVDIPCGTVELTKLIPNAFSPNSDGQNEKLCVPNNLCIKSFIIRIYDRWGEKVFESDNISACWDGTVNGKPVNSAVFVYYFDAELTNGEKFSQKGNISLVK